jgi:hypothetical protein
MGRDHVFFTRSASEIVHCFASQPPPMKSTNCKAGAFLFVATSFFASCGEPSIDEHRKPTVHDTVLTTEPEQTFAEGSEKMLLAPATAFPIVCETEFKCAKTAFAAHFTGPLSTDVLLKERKGLRWSALEKIVNDAMADNSLAFDRVAVKIHYGLTRTGTPPDYSYNLEYGLEVVKIEPRKQDIYWTVSLLEDKINLVKNDGDLDASFTRNSWKNGKKKSYFDHVRILRNGVSGQDWDELVETGDHEAYIFKWQDLKKLHENNDSQEFLAIHSIAGPAIRTATLDDDWHHDLGICASSALNTGDLLSDKDHSEYGKPYREKGADLGSPCPPSCVLARFYRYGLAPEEDCECKEE